MSQSIWRGVHGGGEGRGGGICAPRVASSGIEYPSETNGCCNPHTPTRPKLLLPVAGQPILGHILDQLLAVGTRRIVLVTGHMGGSKLWSMCGDTGIRGERGCCDDPDKVI